MTQNTLFADFFKNWNESYQSMATNMPTFDFNSVIETTQKNAEAAATAQKTLAEGFQKATKRQMEIMQENSENILKLFGEVSGSQDPKESASKQAEFTQTLVKKTTNDAQEVAEILTASGQKAAELISAQVASNMESAQSAATKTAKAATKATKAAA